MTNPSAKRLTLRLEGRVQGVGFRWYVMHRSAQWPLIRGFVRNTHDGAVEVVAEGPPDDIKDFEAVVAKGPPEAHVSKVIRHESAADGQFHIFEIRM